MWSIIRHFKLASKLFDDAGFYSSLDRQVVIGSVIHHALASPLSVLAGSSEEKQRSDAVGYIEDVLRDFQKPRQLKDFSAAQTIALLKTQLEAVDEYSRIYFAHSSLSAVYLRGKQSLLIEAVLCLVHNALQASSQTMVGINCSASNGYLKIVVTDLGKGMSYIEQKLALKPRVTFGKTGTGIGLPFAKWVTERVFLGQFALVSKSGLGTMVVLQIPTLPATPVIPDTNTPHL